MKLMRILTFILAYTCQASNGSAHGQSSGIFEERYLPSMVRSAQGLADELGIGWPHELPKMYFSQKLTLDGQRYRCVQNGIEFGRKVSDQTILWAITDCRGHKGLDRMNGLSIAWGALDLGKTDYGITRNKRRLDRVKKFQAALRTHLSQERIPQKIIRIVGEESTPYVSRTEIGIPTYLTAKALKNLLVLAESSDVRAAFTMPLFSRRQKTEYQEKIQLLFASLPGQGVDIQVSAFTIDVEGGVMKLTKAGE